MHLLSLIALLILIGLTVFTYFRDIGDRRVCSCRPDNWQQEIPNRQARRLRLIVGLGLLVIAGLAFTVSFIAGLIVLYFAIPHLIAYKLSYPGCPELGIPATLIKRHTAFSGCGPWCVVDRRFYCKVVK